MRRIILYTVQSNVALVKGNYRIKHNYQFSPIVTSDYKMLVEIKILIPVTLLCPRVSARTPGENFARRESRIRDRQNVFGPILIDMQKVLLINMDYSSFRAETPVFHK